MFCILSFVVLGALGLFSATHRVLAKEAFGCVMRRITFRPCEAGFSEKMRGRIVGWLMNRSALAAKLFNRHFELLSWILFVAMVASTFWAVRGAINFYRYGSCNGLNESGFCPFDPAGAANKITQPDSDVCPVGPHDKSSLDISKLNVETFPTLRGDANNRIVFIGCYACEYTRRTYPIVKGVAERKRTSFTFIHFPVKGKTEYLSKYDYCIQQSNPELFWKFNDALLSSPVESIEDEEYVNGIVKRFSADSEAILSCVNDPQTDGEISRQVEEISKTGIYGTPTVFVDETAVVGPKPERVYRNLLK